MNLNILASDIHMKGCQILDRQLKIQKDQLWEIMNEIGEFFKVNIYI